MDEHTISAVVSAVLAVIGLAIIAVLVSNAANAGSVFTSAGSSLAGVIRCALSPVTGASCTSLIPNVTSTITFNT